MPFFEESKRIEGVIIVRLAHYADERGAFLETFRKEWFPHRTWSEVQVNRSESKAGVLRGLHYHRHQVDYWYVSSGRLRAGLVDMRPEAATFGASELIEMGAENQIGLYIPVGVAHGFLALSDVSLTYVVDNYYDGQDEYGVAWDDPDIGLDWGETPTLISPRDAANPRWCEIMASTP